MMSNQWGEKYSDPLSTNKNIPLNEKVLHSVSNLLQKYVLCLSTII